MPDSAQTPEVRVVCALGMHRSGTSAIAGILNLLGVYLGTEKHLSGSAEDNPKGFWEHRSMVDLNDEILLKGGGNWHEPPAFPSGWEGMPKFAHLRQRARALILEDFGAAKLWGWKDPRTCLTLPFWQRLVSPMRYVICLRNPIDVARSLAQRDEFSFEKGVNLWLTYVSSALEHTTGQARILVFYEDIMEHRQRELQRLAGFLENPELAEQTEFQSAVEKFIEVGLQHYHTSVVDTIHKPELDFPTKALYLTLRLYVGPQDKGFRNRRDLDETLQKALDSFGRYSAGCQTDLEQLQTRINEWEQRVVENEQITQDLRTQLRDRKQAAQQLQQRLSWKRYRIVDGLVAIYWHIRHLKLLRIAKDNAWQLARKWLPIHLKAWIKRTIFHQILPPWQPRQQWLVGSIRPAEIPRTDRYDVIILPIIAWGFRFQRPQQLARQFAKHGHRIFYLKPNFDDGKKLKDGQYTVTPIEKNIVELQLHSPLPLNIYADQIDESTLQQWLETFDRLRWDHGIVEAVVLVQLPFWRPLVFQLHDKFCWKIVYDCMDEHSGFSTNDHMMLKEEETLSRDSDLVMATSQQLLTKQQRYNANCLLIPNACDFDHFSVAIGPVPARLAALSKPIIGYYGAISDWFDTELIAGMARLRPDWNFVLMGSTYGAQLHPLQDLANVHLIEEQPYSVLPTYLQAYDVCLIPFKLTPLTEATDPVKFYEYLCAGKPIVSIPLPELVPYEAEGLVSLATGSKESAEKIERAMQQNSVELVAKRKRFAQRNTWQERFVCIQYAVCQIYKKASIVVITRDNFHLNKLCIESIFRNTLLPNFEIVIVDNASTDGTREYLEKFAHKHEQVQLILNDRNESFARANNQGIQSATGEYIVLLNNDTILTRGWLGRFIRHLERDYKIGMVGPVTNSAGNEARIETSYVSLEEMERFAECRALKYEGQCFDIKMLAMFCVAMRRTLFDEVGLLDERFEVGMFEDDDLALRVRRAGYKIICSEDIFVHHFHSATFMQFGEQEYLRLFEVNRKKFEQKWGIRWEPHRYRDHLEKVLSGR